MPLLSRCICISFFKNLFQKTKFFETASNNRFLDCRDLSSKMSMLPSIDQMSVVQYDIAVSVFPMMCVVENTLKFNQNENLNEDLSPGLLNEDSSPGLLNAKFVYPLHDEAKMNKFVAHIIPTDPSLSDDDRTDQTRSIQATIEEIHTARHIFNQAKVAKRAAVLTELDEAAKDSFICQLGSIPSQHEVICEFSYFMVLSPVTLEGRLQNENTKTVRLHIPMSQRIRHVTPGGTVPALNEAAIGRKFLRSMTIESQPGDTISGRTVDEVQRIVHKDEANEAKWRLDERQLNSKVEDIELYIHLKSQPIAHGELSSAFEYYPQKGEAIFGVHITPIGDKSGYIDSDPGPKEYQMLVDRSGSMHGKDIERAKEALKMLLNQLPPDDTTFNIISFGSNFSKLWATAQPYNDDNLAYALDHVDGMNADYGGTEVLPPLQAAIEGETRGIRDVILITDGADWNTAAVLKYVALHKATNRVWGVGIGDGCSTGK